MECRYCKGKCVKKGIRNGKQKLFCKSCFKYQQADYSNNAYSIDLNMRIIRYVKEGLGIRSISRILKVSTNTVISRIIKIARTIKKPMIQRGKTYEVDELKTYIRFKKNGYWVISAFCRETKHIAAFTVGKRNNRNLRKVIDTLLLSDPAKIFTDKRRGYLSLIPKKLHSTKQYNLNHLERFHLTLRTALKRLNRRTICYSRSLVVLSSCLKIYVWGD